MIDEWLADDLPANEIARLAEEGASFDWLSEEPDIYDDSFGEPVDGDPTIPLRGAEGDASVEVDLG